MQTAAQVVRVKIQNVGMPNDTAKAVRRASRFGQSVALERTLTRVHSREGSRDCGSRHEVQAHA